MYINELRRFFLLFRKYDVLFFSSNKPKDVSTRYVKLDRSFKSILSEEEFIRTAKQCEKCDDLFVHLFLPLKQNPVLVIDVDSKKNSELALQYNQLVDQQSPFINTTPHGMHFFFLNEQKFGKKLFRRVMKFGFLADHFPGGYVTILGNGYGLKCLEKNPLVIQTLRPAPLLFETVQSKQKRPFIISGQQLYFPSNTTNSLANDIFFFKHFDLNSKLLPKGKGSIEKKNHYALFFALLFPYEDSYSPSFLDLMKRWGAKFKRSEAQEDKINQLPAALTVYDQDAGEAMDFENGGEEEGGGGEEIADIEGLLNLTVKEYLRIMGSNEEEEQLKRELNLHLEDDETPTPPEHVDEEMNAFANNTLEQIRNYTATL